MNWENKASLIKKAVNSTRPGLRSQLTMAPEPRPGHKVYSEVKGQCKKAGIMILFFPKKNQLHLILTLRTALVQYHPNQISFPGGQCDPKENPLDAALRETEEELGIESTGIKILGQLTPLYIPPSDYCVYPVVGFMNQQPEYVPRTKEVAEVIEIPVSHLMDDRNSIIETWELNEREVKVPFYLFDHQKIWGATAMVLAELLDIIRPVLKNQL
ncbi:MAG: NUDIX domain-containing protein [Candidatus Aminicenantes bacterium]|nr:NUDIX domain-containing protein [Candidatus Aminicenantes bacterium]